MRQIRSRFSADPAATPVQSIRRRSFPVKALLWTLGVCTGRLALAQLPPVLTPPENPITEQKRLLGKILFWEEQLASDNTVACGTCHTPGRAGADQRIGVHPGPDLVVPSPDDIFGSPGVTSVAPDGQPVADPIFGLNPQVTGRSANVAIGAAFAPELFWDGRARSTFLNPETGSVSIANGGALENQAIAPILSSVEMARQGRNWTDVARKLTASEPLGESTGLPTDLLAALASHPSYPQLFQDAFGDPAITAERIAHAIATYERTLVADQTPWDRFMQGNPAALTPGQQAGWNFFRNSPCSVCHAPPFFTDHSFRNIGVRPVAEDTGRQAVTGVFEDRGRFKVPTLRNAGLKITFMHNGRLNSIPAVIGHYRPNNPARSPENLDPLLPVPVPPEVGPALNDFLTNGLTDPRVAGQTFPFDRPVLHAGTVSQLFFDPDDVTLRWPAVPGVASYVVYRGMLSSLVDADHDGLPDAGYGVCVSGGGGDPDPSDTTFVDPAVPAGGDGFFYLKGVVDGGITRGLGVTSGGRSRQVTSPCP